MQKFKSPPQHFLEEMIQANIQHSKTPLVFDGVPRPVLEKILHHSAICSLLGESAPKIDISLGPDEEYHHEIKGISSVTSRIASVYYKDDDDSWYQVAITMNNLHQMDFSLLISRLVENDWEMLELPEEEEKISALALDALEYLGIMN